VVSHVDRKPRINAVLWCPVSRGATCRKTAILPVYKGSKGSDTSKIDLMKRLLLLIPTESYRSEAFIKAASRLGVDLVIASEEASTLESLQPDHLMTLNFLDLEDCRRKTDEFSKERPLDCILAIDDESLVAAAFLAEALGLSHPVNRMESIRKTQGKDRLRQALAEGGRRQPSFCVWSVDDDAEQIAKETRYPAVLKPLGLAASRGVMRVNHSGEFSLAHSRLMKILDSEASRRRMGDRARFFLVEDYLPGVEVALEGLLTGGQLQSLALFDKPDALDGPYFEETIYVTPSCLSKEQQDTVIQEVGQAVQCLGLTEGPIHAEVRIDDEGPWIVEVAPRSIGGTLFKGASFCNWFFSRRNYSSSCPKNGYSNAGSIRRGFGSHDDSHPPC